MIAAAKPIVTSSTFSPRVMELRKKIHDANYIEYAVQRIAQVLSRQLVEDDEQLFAQSRRMYGAQ